MDRWAFRSYVENGSDQVQLWYEQQLPSVQAELLNIIMYLRDAPIDDWSRPDYAQLRGKLASLSELRLITCEGNQTVHYRVLGFLEEAALEFTMLAAARKTRHFGYAEIGALALARKHAVQLDRDKYSWAANWIGELDIFE
jgi:hypothetical protein